jgi:hypothetical protein
MLYNTFTLYLSKSNKKLNKKSALLKQTTYLMNFVSLQKNKYHASNRK